MYPVRHAKGKLAPLVRASGRPCRYSLIRIGRQNPSAADAAQAAWTRATARRLVPVRLLALRRRYAGVARCLGRSTKLRLQLRDPSRQRLNLRPKRQDQSILVIVRQSAQVRKLGHPQLESNPACSRQPHTKPTAKTGGLSRYIECAIRAIHKYFR